MSFLIGVISTRGAMPPVGKSCVIGNQVPARDDHLQWRVGSELLVNRARMIPDGRWLVWRMGFSGEERLRAVVEVPADRFAREIVRFLKVKASALAAAERQAVGPSLLSTLNRTIP